MSYGYSAKTKAFYLIEDEKGYAKYGNWPDDVKPISDEIWEKYSVQGPPGKTRGADKDGLPCWVDIPPPTHEESRRDAEYMKWQLMEEAMRIMAPLQDAVDLDMATEAEKSALLAWKKCLTVSILAARRISTGRKCPGDGISRTTCGICMA